MNKTLPIAAAFTLFAFSSEIWAQGQATQPQAAQPAPAQPEQSVPADSYPAQEAYPEQAAYPEQQQPYPPAQQQAGAYPPPQQGYPPAQPGPLPPHVPSAGPVPGSNPDFLKMSTPELEEELDDTGLGGPITFLAIGVPSVLIGTPWFIGSLIGMGACETVDTSYYYDNNCSNAYVGPLIVSSVLLGVGIPFTILGSIMLPKRIAKRRALNNEIELRENYGKASAFQLRHGPLPTPGGGFSYGFNGTF